MHEHLRIAKSLAKLLDSQFGIGRFKFGLDPIIGLIPGVGDIASFALALYIYWIGLQLKIPKEAQQQMFRNIVRDLIIGIVPIVGEIWDFAYKSNMRNYAILSKYAPSDMIEAEIVGHKREP